MMELHKGYWICGSAVPGPPNTRYWLTQATVCERHLKGNIIEIVRVQDDNWRLDFKELAEWFGLELSRMIVDHGINHGRNISSLHSTSQN